MTRMLAAVCILLSACASSPTTPNPGIVGCYAITIAPQRFMIQNDYHSLYFSAPKIIELTSSAHPDFTNKSGFKLVKTSPEPSVNGSLWRANGNNVSLRLGNDFNGIYALLTRTDKGFSGPAEPYTDIVPYTIYGGHLYATRIDCQKPNN